MENTVAIQCSVTGKLLARRDARGIYLWCKACKVEHFFPWNTKDSEAINVDKVASEADLCYNLGG